MPSKPVFAVVACAYFGSLLAGCAGAPPLAALEPYSHEKVHAFLAHGIADDGNQATLSLDGPVEITDFDRQAFQAYVLRSEVELEGDNRVMNYYLDADLRLVARQEICRFSFHDCQNYTAWYWFVQGDLPPFGLGYPTFILDDEFYTWASKRSIHGNWSAETDSDDVLHLTVSVPPEDEPTTYRYLPGRPLPDGDWLTVTTFELGPELSGAERLTPLTMPPYREWNGEMFDGEDEDPFDIGATHLEIAQAADSRVGQQGDVCVQQYQVRPTPREASPLPSLQDYTTAIAHVAVFVPGEARFYNVEVGKRGLDGSTWFQVEPSHEPVPTPRTCEEIRKSPWPSLSFEEGFEFAQTANLSGTFHHFAYSINALSGRSPEAGRHQWQFRYVPDYVAASSQAAALYLYYRISFEPIPGTPLLALDAHPDDALWR